MLNLKRKTNYIFLKEICLLGYLNVVSLPDTDILMIYSIICSIDDTMSSEMSKGDLNPFRSYIFLSYISHWLLPAGH